MWIDKKAKIIDFFKKHKKKILLIVIIWAVVFAVNMVLGQLNKTELPKTSYQKHSPTISGSDVPKRLQDPIEEEISKYMDFCKNKQYEEAFAMITQECKEYKFSNNIERFKTYVNYIFHDNDIYTIQNYSNNNDIYIYKVTIGEDILATGMNGKNSDEYYEEKIAIKKEDNKDLSLSVGGYIGKTKMEYVGEDEYMKIWIEEKTVTYENEIYTVKIKNKTDQNIILANSSEANEILLVLGADERAIVTDRYEPNNIVLRAGNTRTFEMKFNKYFDEGREADKIVFNKIRVLPRYTGNIDKWEEELAGASKLYSISLNLKHNK